MLRVAQSGMSGASVQSIRFVFSLTYLVVLYILQPTPSPIHLRHPSLVRSDVSTSPLTLRSKIRSTALEAQGLEYGIEVFCEMWWS